MMKLKTQTEADYPQAHQLVRYPIKTANCKSAEKTASSCLVNIMPEHKHANNREFHANEQGK